MRASICWEGKWLCRLELVYFASVKISQSQTLNNNKRWHPCHCRHVQVLLFWTSLTVNVPVGASKESTNNLEIKEVLPLGYPPRDAVPYTT
jgi:hypothetical protein